MGRAGGLRLAGRRNHLTRTTLGVLLALAFWVALIAGLMRVAATPGARAWASHEIARKLSGALAQPVTVADTRVTLIPPRLTVLGVELGPPGALAARVAVIEIGLGQVRLAERELVLSQVRLRGIRISGSVPKTATGGREPWLRVVVRQLIVEDLQVEHLDLPGGLVIAVADVDARWAGSTRTTVAAAVVHAVRVTVSAPGVEPMQASVNIWGRRTERGWEIGRLRADGQWWKADLHGEVAGGEVHAEGTVGCDLASLERTLRIGAGLAGHAEARVQAKMASGELRVDAQVDAPSVRVVSFPFTDVRGEAHVSREGIEASLTRATFAGGQVEGSYALAGFGSPWAHHVAARGNRVELAGFLAALGVDAAGLASSVQFTADVAWDGTQIKEGNGTGVAELSAGAGDVPAAGHVVVSLAGDGALAISTERTTLANAPVRWEGRLSLGSWVPNWAIEGEKLPVAVIARLLRGWVGTDVLPAELKGETVIDLRLRGPFRDLSVVGDVAVAPISFGSVAADGAQGLLRVGGGIAAIEGGVILVGKGRVSCEGSLDFAHGLALDLRLTGRRVPLDRLAEWAAIQAPVAGTVDFSGPLFGTIDSPRANADLHLAGVSLAGASFGDGSGRIDLAGGVVSLSDLHVGPLTAVIAIDVLRREARVDATLANFGLEAISPPLARLAGGALDCSFHGAFPFDSPSGRLDVASTGGAKGFVEIDRKGIEIDVSRPQVWRLAGHLRQADGGYGGNVEFAVLSWRRAMQDLLGGELPVDGELEGHAEVTFARNAPARLDGEITRLASEVEGERAELGEPARFSIVGSAVTLQGARLVGPHSSLFVRASRREDGTLAGNIAGQFPAALLGFFIPSGHPRGNIELLGELLGTDQAPRFEGVARVEKGSMTVPGLPGPLTGIDGVFEFVPEVIALSGVKFQLVGGEGTCNGRIILSPALEFDLTARAKHVRWPLSTTFVPTLQGEVRIVGTLDNLLANGELTLERTVYRRELSLQRLIVEGLLAPARVAPETGAVNLNLHVAVPGTFELAMPLARLTARGDVRVVGTSARPGLLGRLEVLPGGELEMSGVRYELDRATVTFTDPTRIEPFLDVVGHTTVQSWDITVTLVGTLERLTPTFTSTPPLPEMDIVALLSTGRRIEQVGQVQAGAVASTFLTEQLTGAVTSRARSLLALDQLSVDPVAASETGNPAARLTLAKQLSRDWIVTVSTTLASNREEVIVSRWRLGPGVFLEATRDVDGSYSMDVRWQHRY